MKVILSESSSTGKSSYIHEFIVNSHLKFVFEVIIIDTLLDEISVCNGYYVMSYNNRSFRIPLLCRELRDYYNYLLRKSRTCCYYHLTSNVYVQMQVDELINFSNHLKYSKK